MFYLSKGEQVALFVLLALFLAGAGVLVYRQGVAAGRAQQQGALLVAAPEAPSISPENASITPLPPSPLSAQDGQVPVGAGDEEKIKKATSPTPTPKIHLNTATLAQLDSLPGVGPVIAQRILDYREQLRRNNGRGFSNVDELLNVTGIGAKRLRALRERVTL